MPRGDPPYEETEDRVFVLKGIIENSNAESEEGLAAFIALMAWYEPRAFDHGLALLRNSIDQIIPT